MNRVFLTMVSVFLTGVFVCLSASAHPGEEANASIRAMRSLPP